MMDLPMKVAVSLPVFEEFAREAGGENVEVISLVPRGVDPHTYRLTEEDIESIADVDFFFVNGLGLDSAITEQIEANRKEDAKVIPFAPNTRSPRGAELGDPDITAEEAGDNPHLWLDPGLAAIYVEIVADTLVIYDGVNKALYDSNFMAFREEMTDLAIEVEQSLQAVPPERRRIISFHDAFEIFALRFDLEVAGSVVESPSDPVDNDSIDALEQTCRVCRKRL
jgi:ABC-type Zn uptake system ZnuABC Zn-binding protein ZnuA